MKSYYIDTGNDSEQLRISEIDVSYENYYSGSPYNTGFKVKVVSGDFVGTSKFEYNIKDFIKFIKKINKLYGGSL